jgi:DNA polymerase III delta prime subunit
MQIYTGKQNKSYHVALYGPPGVGKSTLASTAERAFFINVENGLHQINCARSNVIEGTDDIKKWLSKIAKEHPEEYDTIVIDTIDAVEDLMIKEVCKKHGKESLAAFPFGQGYDLCNKKWTEILGWCDFTATYYQKNIIWIGHDQVKRYEDPLGDGWDRMTLKMHHKSALTLVSKVDALLYMTWDKQIRTTENKVRKAIGTGRRIIHTQESPAYLAKNRYALEPKIEAQSDFFANLKKLSSNVALMNNEQI